MTDIEFARELEDHAVPVELIELYEVLEWTGEISPPPALRLAAPEGTRGALSVPEHFVSRAQWRARMPKNPYADITDTAVGNTLHYEGPHMGVFSHSSCATKVRAIQAFHMDERGWNDVAYNTIVCPHGYIFDCRGYGNRSGANGTRVGNDTSYTHCALIGQGDPVTKDLKIALTRVREWYEGLGSGENKYGHRDWKATACPGDPLYEFTTEGWSYGSPEPTPTNVPSIEEDTMAFVELIERAYRKARGKDYDPRVEDPNGWTFWMERLATGTSVNGGEADGWTTVQEMRWIIAVHG